MTILYFCKLRHPVRSTAMSKEQYQTSAFFYKKSGTYSFRAYFGVKLI